MEEVKRFQSNIISSKQRYNGIGVYALPLPSHIIVFTVVAVELAPKLSGLIS